MSKCEACGQFSADFLIKERTSPFRRLKVCADCYHSQKSKVYQNWECTSIVGKQTDLVADFNFPKVPTTLKIKSSASHPVYPCTDCDQKKYCREHDDYLNCDRYIQWRKERGFSPVTKVGK